MVLLFLAYVAHAATNVGGDALDHLFENWVSDAIPAGCALLCLMRAWRIRAERAAWTLLGLGIALWAAGDVYYSLYLGNQASIPIPSVADGLWLSEYPASVLAVLLLMRSRHSGDTARVWLDGSIAGLAVSAVSAAIVLPAVIGASTHAPTAEFLTNVAYPVGDMILLGSIGAALAVRHWRINRMWGSLALGFLAFALSDGLFLINVAKGTYIEGTIVDAGWLLGGLCFATAAWQPVDTPAAAGSRGRLAHLLPSVFGSTALLLLVWDHFERLTTVALLLSAAAVAAVLGRMTLALNENLRMVARLREEAQALSMKNEELLEVDALKEALRQAQKMDALGQLAGGVAHDFNNLLTVISGYATLLRGEVGGDPAAAAKIDAITTAAERANDLTRQLLTLSPRQVVQTSHVDLNASVRETETLIASALGQNIRLELRLGDDLPPISADAGQISQVLVNLVLNARDAMPSGGTVVIATTRGQFEGRGADLEDADRESALLTVTDTGTGIDVETQARIFEPFFSTKGKNGTGLGLATVYGIVERGGGSITVDSIPGAGSTFSVMFPASPDTASVVRDDPIAGADASASRRVLLVEDERAVRELLVAQLEALGHHVVAAATPAHACEIYERLPDDFDVMVTDVVMPGIDGWHLTKRLRTARPDLPVVLMSGYTDGAVDGHDVGGSTAFLLKPFSIAALAEAVQAVVDEQRIGLALSSAP
jgi:signal transduction histidine kinase/ActR/RegA family two-component response regulator